MIFGGLAGIPIHIPLASAAYLDGITLDADLPMGAVRVENPNLLDVVDGVAFIRTGGGCEGCGMAEVTLGQGVRTAMLDTSPDIREVHDTTDHAEGANPHDQAAKK